MKMRTHRPLAALLLASLLLTACAAAPEDKGDMDTAGIKELSFEEADPPALADLKIGVLYSGNETTPGDSASLFRGTREAAQALGLDQGQVLEKTGITADTSEAAAAELSAAGCRLIFSTDTSFEDGVLLAAAASPDADFCQLGGDKAALDTLDNTHNYNVRLSESYFGAGTLAAYMSQTLKIGCVSRSAAPEEIAEFTAFYLAAMTRNSAITLDVIYTGSDSGEDLQRAARSLAGLGCDVIATTIDSDAAESVCGELGIWYIGRNGAEESASASARLDPSADETDAYGADETADAAGENETGTDYDLNADEYAQNGGLTGEEGSGSSSGHPRRLATVDADWAAYMILAADSLTKGVPIPADWSGGLAEEAVSLSTFNPDAVPEEGRDLAAASLDKVRTRERMIFAIDGFSVGGERLQVYYGPDGIDYVAHGYFHDQDPDFGGSSSIFDLIVDGITVHDLSALTAAQAVPAAEEGSVADGSFTSPEEGSTADGSFTSPEEGSTADELGLPETTGETQESSPSWSPDV